MGNKMNMINMSWMYEILGYDTVVRFCLVCECGGGGCCWELILGLFLNQKIVIF